MNVTAYRSEHKSSESTGSYGGSPTSGSDDIHITVRKGSQGTEQVPLMEKPDEGSSERMKGHSPDAATRTQRLGSAVFFSVCKYTSGTFVRFNECDALQGLCLTLPFHVLCSILISPTTLLTLSLLAGDIPQQSHPHVL